jgi:hypothetical protein
MGELKVARISCFCGNPLSLVILPKDLEKGREFSLKCHCGVNWRIDLRSKPHPHWRQKPEIEAGGPLLQAPE